ncbi:MAG: histidinol dehydrogenase, partial [Cucumibacter sp.]
MPQRLNSRSPGFKSALAKLLDARLEISAEIDASVAAIIADVRARGDAALCELTEKFDRTKISPAKLRLNAHEIKEAAEATPPKVRAALEFAHARILAHHQKQRPADHIYTDEIGVTLGTLWSPVASAGIYVPGGLASYPSSVLMNAVPARVAGVARIAMTVPAP